MDFSSDYNSNKFLELTNASLNEIINHIKRTNLWDLKIMKMNLQNILIYYL